MQNNEPDRSFFNSPIEDNFASTAITPSNEPAVNDEAGISWVAPEFLQHDKSPMWYLGLLTVTVVLAVSFFFILNRDLFAPIIVTVLGLSFGLAGARKPRDLNYSINNQILSIANRKFNFEDFRSFTVAHEGSSSSLLLMPVKRFSAPLNLYVPDEKLNQVAESISLYLPVENHEPGYIDKFLSRIRF